MHKEHEEIFQAMDSDSDVDAIGQIDAELEGTVEGGLEEDGDDDDEGEPSASPEETEEVLLEEVLEEEEPFDPYEELREELRTEGGEWYVVHTYSGHERKVRENLLRRVEHEGLEDSITRVEVPMEEVTEIRNTVRKKVLRPLIPGYVLVQMQDYLDDILWRVVKETPAVTGFVGDQYNPMPIKIDEVVDMLGPGIMAGISMKQPAVPVAEPVVEYRVSEVVRVTDGPFEGKTAEISEVTPETSRLRVFVTIFERETPVELRFDQVEKID